MHAILVVSARCIAADEVEASSPGFSARVGARASNNYKIAGKCLNSATEKAWEMVLEVRLEFFNYESII